MSQRASTARKAQQRGLHVLCWCLATFLVGQALLSPVFDYVLPEYRFPWFHRLVEQATQARTSETILCLGSSRFGTGLFAGEMTAQLREANGSQNVLIINAAVPGGDYITSERLLQQLLEHGVRPRLLLLEFCPEMLNHKMGWLNLHTVRTLCWHDLKDYGSELDSFQHLQRFAACRFFPLVQYRHSIRTRLTDRYLTPTNDESPEESLLSSTDHHWIEELQQPAWPVAKQMSELAGHFEKYQIGGQPIACLHRLLERCRQEEIEVALIEPPVAAAHRQFYTPEIDHEYKAFRERLQKEHGVRFHGYRSAAPEEEFYDHHHCNRTGAHRWGTMVVQQVIVPTWSRLTER